MHKIFILLLLCIYSGTSKSSDNPGESVSKKQDPISSHKTFSQEYAREVKCNLASFLGLLSYKYLSNATSARSFNHLTYIAQSALASVLVERFTIIPAVVTGISATPPSAKALQNPGEYIVQNLCTKSMLVTGSTILGAWLLGMGGLDNLTKSVLGDRPNVLYTAGAIAAMFLAPAAFLKIDEWAELDSLTTAVEYKDTIDQVDIVQG